jgi:hypothetical protein
MTDVSQFNQAMMCNLLALKQDWPSLRMPICDLAMNQDIPIPFLRNRIRVQGSACVHNSSEKKFLESGVNELRCVLNIAEVFGFRGGAVLDWGVGCGRMARHLPQPLMGRFAGVDVDPVNVEWCEQNIPFGEYFVIDPHGRIPAQDGWFDLVYSYSVFTHLSEEDQDHWLQELARVTKGVIVVSVHGLYAAAHMASWAHLPEVVGPWLQHGFQDAGIPNPDISDVVDSDYYRDVAHTPAYIRDRWSQYVDVLDIIPGGIGADHDAVVCRPKEARSAEAT